MRPTHISSDKLFSKASKIATLYGFDSVNKVFEDYRGTKKKKIATPQFLPDKRLQHLSILLRFCLEKSIDLEENPLFVYHTNIDSNIKRVMTSSKKTDESYFTLSILGIEGPYAEALLISCAYHIFNALNSKANTIRLNTMGTTKDSKAYFSQLKKTLKKCKENLSQECTHLIERSRFLEAHPLLYQEDHIGVYEHLIPTLRHVSGAGNLHFEKLIEYIEQQGFRYELANELVQLPEHGNHTVFELCSENTTLHAVGGRYDALAKTCYRKEIPVASVTITIPEKTVGMQTKARRVSKPKIFLFHAGEKAQLRSLSVFTQLLNLNIPVAQRLHCSRVGDQLEGKRQDFQYLAVFGQEEVDGGRISVKNTDTREFVSYSLHNMDDLKRIRSLL